MKYINFNNLPKEWTTELKQSFYKDKGKFLASHKMLLTSSQINQPSLSLSEFRAGYIICEEDDVIIDIDNDNGKDSDKIGEAFIQSLLKKEDIPYVSEITKKGKHYFFKLPKDFYKCLNSSKKDVYVTYKGRRLKIELKFRGAWVFGGPEIDFYYKPHVGSSSNISSLECNNFGSLEVIRGLISSEASKVTLKNSGKFVSFNRSQADFVNKVVENSDLIIPGDIEPIIMSGFLSHFGYVFSKLTDHRINTYSDFLQVLNEVEGIRNISLFFIMSACCRNLFVEPSSTYEFLKLVNECFFDEPLPKEEFEASFSLRRIHKYNIDSPEGSFLSHHTKNEVIKDVHQHLQIRQEFIADDIYIDLTPGGDKRYFRSRWNEEKREIEFIELNKNENALKKVIIDDDFLSLKYVKIETDSKGQTKQVFSPPYFYRGIIEKGKDQLSMNWSTPFLSIDTDNNVILDYTSHRYNPILMDALLNEGITKEKFDNLSIVKLARHNLFESEGHEALFYSNLRDVLLNQKSTERAFLFKGGQGIGKDTFIDFISHCILKKDYFGTESFYKKTISEYVKDTKWSSVLKASIIMLNEGGENDIINSQVLNSLNSIVGTQYASRETKFKNETLTQKIICQLFVLATNEASVDLTGYANTRLIINECPASQKDSLRTNKSFLNDLFRGRSAEQVIQEESETFISYILQTDEFISKVALLEPSFGLTYQSDEAQERIKILSEESEVERAYQSIAQGVLNKDLTILDEIVKTNSLASSNNIKFKRALHLMFMVYKTEGLKGPELYEKIQKLNSLPFIKSTKWYKEWDPHLVKTAFIRSDLVLGLYRERRQLEVYGRFERASVIKNKIFNEVTNDLIRPLRIKSDYSKLSFDNLKS